MIYMFGNEIDEYELPLLLADKTLVAEGYYGTVYSVQSGHKKYALKVFKDTMNEAPIYDYEVLEDLHDLPYFPTMHAFKDEKWMLTDFIYGDALRFADKINSYSLDMLDMFRAAESRGWLAHDIKGDNIIIEDNTNLPVIVDVGAFLPIPIEKEELDLPGRAAWVMAHAHIFPSVCQPLPEKLFAK